MFPQDGRGDQHKYDLYAVVKHSGSFHGGHYYAVIKSFEDHQWYEFNDSTVRKVNCFGYLAKNES